MLAKTPGTFLHAALTGDEWTRTEHLLAAAVDVLALANWQRSGGKGSRPKPISPAAQPASETVGESDRSPEETVALLEKYRTGVFDSGG